MLVQVEAVEDREAGGEDDRFAGGAVALDEDAEHRGLGIGDGVDVLSGGVDGEVVDPERDAGVWPGGPVEQGA